MLKPIVTYYPLISDGPSYSYRILYAKNNEGVLDYLVDSDFQPALDETLSFLNDQKLETIKTEHFKISCILDIDFLPTLIKFVPNYLLPDNVIQVAIQEDGSVFNTHTIGKQFPYTISDNLRKTMPLCSSLV